VVLPSGEVLALNVVVEIGDGGVITSVSENLVGSGPAGVPAAAEELPSTGVRSSSLPLWAIITIFGGLLLIVYGRRAVKIAEEFDARLDENGHRTPWEILSTPIRVPGIDYSPGPLDGAGSSQSLDEAIRGLDVALSLILASQIARLRTHA
jgi:LPXTG-motif cell wall-anchored protein